MRVAAEQVKHRFPANITSEIIIGARCPYNKQRTAVYVLSGGKA
jgi:hypothetical protein